MMFASITGGGGEEMKYIKRKGGGGRNELNRRYIDWKGGGRGMTLQGGGVNCRVHA